MSLGIEPIKQDKLTITPEEEADKLSLSFAGSIDMENPGEVLGPLFERVHNGALENNLKEVLVDFTELTFLNSSGIKELSKWIMKLGATAEDQRYLIRIRHNKNTTWQATSLPTLTYLVPGTVEIE